MGCGRSHAVEVTTDDADNQSNQDAPVLVRSISTLTTSERLKAGSVQSQFESALKLDWSNFDWTRDCEVIHSGSMKVVGCLKSHKGVAVASVLRGTGEDVIPAEVSTLTNLVAEGIRTVEFADRILDVPCYDSSIKANAKAYLIQHFSEETAFFYEEGKPGTEDHVKEPMRKLRILSNDEGDWTMNRDTIRVLKERKLEKEFMEDLTAYVALMLSKGVRVNDFQGLLGKDGHFYLADPLEIQPIEPKVNRHLLEGVFMRSSNPHRENKPYREAFSDTLGMNLGVDVPDEE